MEVIVARGHRLGAKVGRVTPTHLEVLQATRERHSKPKKTTLIPAHEIAKALVPGPSK